MLDRLLTDLDADQRRAVATESTLVAVTAPAGSGKTRVLTRRIAYRVAAGTADAEHTLALTFTREAAGELRRRLRHSGVRSPIEAGTFHAVALGVLRQRWTSEHRAAPTIIDDPHRLLAEIAEGIATDILAGSRSWAAALGLAGGAYTAAADRVGRRLQVANADIGAALERYEQLKRSRGVIDLDDLLTSFGRLMERDREFNSAVRWRFRHVLVDEAQDLNPAQYRMLKAIVGERRDLFLVGDPAQAIYGFNGADPQLLTDVDRSLPGVEVVRLRTNHRCTPEIVATGRQVLHNAGQPIETVASRTSGPTVTFLVGSDEFDEADHIAGFVARQPPSAIARGEIAVLARTHDQLTVLRRRLDEHGIAIRRVAVAAGGPLAAALRTAGRQSRPGQLRAWAHDVLDTKPVAHTGERSAEELADARVARAVLDYLRDAPLGDGPGFRGWVGANDPFSAPGDQAGIEVMTFHAAKGREWPTVIVSGVETGLVPHRSATTTAARAEEGRLLHVAVTRAADRLVVSRAERRRGYRRKPSPLLDGLETVLGELARSNPPVAVPTAIREAVADRGDDEHAERLAALWRWRDGVARFNDVVPTAICADRDLEAIAAAAPTTVEQLLAVGCFGPATAARHFDGVEAAVTRSRR